MYNIYLYNSRGELVSGPAKLLDLVPFQAQLKINLLFFSWSLENRYPEYIFFKLNFHSFIFTCYTFSLPPNLNLNFLLATKMKQLAYYTGKKKKEKKFTQRPLCALYIPWTTAWKFQIEETVLKTNHPSQENLDITLLVTCYFNTLEFSLWIVLISKKKWTNFIDVYQVRVYIYILSLVFFYLKKKENRYKSKNKIIHGRY